jgi:hypothetical protein
MEIIRLKKETDLNGDLSLMIHTEQKNRQVEIVVVITPEEVPPKKPALENFFGKLHWKGGALAEQRRLRNEWS